MARRDADTPCRRPTVSTARIERTTVLGRDYVVQESVEGLLEDSLQTAQYEVTSGVGIHHKAQVVRKQVFTEPVALDPGVLCQLSD